MPIEQLALSIHIGTIITLVSVILYTDHLGLWWVLGKKETIALKKLHMLHGLVWAGLLLMLASGFTMFLSYKDFLLFTPVFYVKMVFVAALVINAFFIGKLMHIATQRVFVSLSSKEKFSFFISGGVSTVSWAGAIICGLLLSNLI